MIDHDDALTIAREHLTAGSRAGGLVTLYGYPTHWIANCTFPDGKTPAGGNTWIRIENSNGAVTEIANP